MAEDTWFARDLPVLDFLVEELDKVNRGRVSAQEIMERTGLPDEAVASALKALSSAGYVDGMTRWQGSYPSIIEGVSREAREKVGQWPTPESLAQRIQTALEQTAEDDAVSEQKRGWARRMLGGVADVGTDVSAKFMAEVVARAMGL